MPHNPHFLLALAVLVALLAGGVWLAAHWEIQGLTFVPSNQVIYHANSVRQALACLSGEKGAGDLIAPVELGLIDHRTGNPLLPVPTELAGRCYTFSVGFDACTGQILYADALLELGPQPCSEELLK